MRRILFPTLIIFTLASSVWAQAAQETLPDLTAIKADLDSVKADLESVKSQLGQVLRLLSQRPVQGGASTSGPVHMSVADAPMLGRADAPVTLVEFSDYECPFCQRFFAMTFPALKKDYVDTGKVRYVFRDFPLDQIHQITLIRGRCATCSVTSRWIRSIRGRAGLPKLHTVRARTVSIGRCMTCCSRTRRRQLLPSLTSKRESWA